MPPVAPAADAVRDRRATSWVRGVVLLVMLSMLMVVPPSTEQAHAGVGDFRDVGASHPFRADIARIAKAGITKGCGNGRFCPDRAVTRGEMAAFIVRMLDLPSGSKVFSDTRRHTFRNEVAALARANITSGCTRTRFCPDEPVTRAQMGTFLAAALKLPAGEHQFRDVPRRSTHARGINALSHSRITRGCDSGRSRFCPYRDITRGEMAAFLSRALTYRTRDVPSWLWTLPRTGTVGKQRTYSGAGKRYALWTERDVTGVRAIGGQSAAMRAGDGGVRIRDSVLGGAVDGLKPGDGTSLVNSVVNVRYSRGAHADHVQVRNIDGVRIERVRMLADNDNGRTVGGWNAAIFVHGSSTNWTIRHVHVQQGRQGRTIQSWFPVRLTSGTGAVDGLIIDRETMRGPTPVQVDDDVTLTRWRDVYIREPGGKLTPVPRP